MRGLNYFLGEAFNNILKSKIEAISSISTISMCIFLIGIMYMTFTNVSSTITKLQNDMNIIAFLKAETSRTTAENLKQHIETNEYVEKVTLYTKEEALREFADEMVNGENFYNQFITDNPLRDSLRIKLKDSKHQDDVEKMLREDTAYVDNIVKANEAIKFLNALNNNVQLISIFFILVLVLISIALIINTIKLTVYIRKNDINIMKYIGATDTFVRTPFIIEGILIGLIGTFLPLLLLYFIYASIVSTVNGNLNNAFYRMVTLRDVDSIYSVLIPLCSVIGIGIGTLGSVISVKKYLNV